MRIPVVLIDGSEELVSKDQLQSLIATQQAMFFQRAEGWVVIGRDQDVLRCQNLPFKGQDRRQGSVPGQSVLQ